MKFALIYAYDPETATPGGAEEIQEWIDLEQEFRDAGVHLYAEGLQPASEARTLSVRAGEETVVERPLTAPHAVAGFWVLDAPSIEEALACARKVPTVRYGKVEVRPIVEWDG